MKMTDGRDGTAIKHLHDSLDHAEKAAELFDDDSRGESVAENVVAWARKAVMVVERQREGGE